MPRNSDGDFALRGIWGTGFAAWLITSACLFVPEWTRSEMRHCGIFVCCSSYRSCGLIDQDILQASLPWIMAGWLLCLIAIFSTMCRCRHVHPAKIRNMALMNVTSGVLIVSGSMHFIVRKITSPQDINFGAAGIFTQIAGWMLFISGLLGFCHGNDLNILPQVSNETPLFQKWSKKNDIEPFKPATEEMSDIYNIPPPSADNIGLHNNRNEQVRLQYNTVPGNFARRFWNENVPVSNDPFTADVPYPTN